MPLTISESQPKTPDITNLTHEYQGLGPFDKSYKSMSNIIDGKILKDQTINLIPIDSNRERIPVPIPSLESHKKSKSKLILEQVDLFYLAKLAENHFQFGWKISTKVIR